MDSVIICLVVSVVWGVALFVSTSIVLWMTGRRSSPPRPVPLKKVGFVTAVVGVVLGIGFTGAFAAEAKADTLYDCGGNQACLMYLVAYASGSQYAVPEATSSASQNCTGHAKNLGNKRKIQSGWFKTDLFWYRIETPWWYCNGDIRKIGGWSLSQDVYDNGSRQAWQYVGRAAVRNGCYGSGIGGQHCAQTVQWTFKLDPVGMPELERRTVCATNQFRGDGRHYRHGSCSLGPWSGTMYG